MKKTFELTWREVAQACGEYVANKDHSLKGKEVEVTLKSGAEGLIGAKLVFDLPSVPSQP